jgi:hypothetical protein
VVPTATRSPLLAPLADSCLAAVLDNFRLVAVDRVRLVRTTLGRDRTAALENNMAMTATRIGRKWSNE